MQKQDQKLEEVRAILQRLQRISTGAEEDEAPPASNGIRPLNPAPKTGQSPPRPQKRAGMSGEMKIAAVALPVFIVLGVAGAFFWSLTGDKAPPARHSDQKAAVKAPKAQIEPEKVGTAAVAPNSDPRPAEARQTLNPATVKLQQAGEPDAERLSVAQRLMDKGKVSEARRVLKNDLASRNAEAALLLARSYDPNSLHLIANADATPDPGEAEHWYRRWSEIAAGQGLALDKERLDRIIKAMH